MKKINLLALMKNMKKKLPEQRKIEIIANLKRNWYFPISAMAFFCLNATLTIGYFIGLLIAFMISIIVASIMVL